jgi:hypothetical protein
MRAFVVWMLLMAVAPVLAHTRVWLDRNEISAGETVVLNIATDQAVDQIDLRPLQSAFDLGGQRVQRTFEWVNGQARRQTVLAIGLRPRQVGVLEIPVVQVGADRTQPLRLVVRAPTVEPATADSDVFVEMSVDSVRPYVQQTVGVTVRLYFAIPLLSGTLDLDTPPGASLQRVGEDVRFERMLGGRRYAVLERHYLLIPERSGPMVLPGARVNALRAAGGADAMLDPLGGIPVTAAAPARLLQVQPVPAQAMQPWLPLRHVQLRYVQLPQQAFTGLAAMVEVEAVADGATAAQMPALEWPGTQEAQVFPEPAQVQEVFVDGRPRTILRRRFAVVPQRPGRLHLVGPAITWWDADAGQTRVTTVPPLVLEVAPANTSPTRPTPAASAAVTPPRSPQSGTGVAPSPAQGQVRQTERAWWWDLAAMALGIGGLWLVAGWGWRRVVSRRGRTARQSESQKPYTAVPGVAARHPPPGLTQALQEGDLARITQALLAAAGPEVRDLEAVCERLAAPAQIDAVRRLQAARWGNGDVETAREALRRAFADGIRWRTSELPRAGEVALPPLYPPA